MSFKLKVKKVKSTPVLEVSGEITGENVSKIIGRLDSLRNNSSKIIAVDLRKTPSLTVMVLGHLSISGDFLRKKTENSFL